MTFSPRKSMASDATRRFKGPHWVPFPRWSAVPLRRPCSTRSSRPPRSRRPSNAWGTATASDCGAAGSQLPRRKRPGGATPHLALDPAPGPDDPRAERAPGLSAGPRRGHVRGRAPAFGRGGPAAEPLGAGRLGCSRVSGWRWESGAVILACERPGDDDSRASRGPAWTAWSKAHDFADYRRADIRFHIGTAEAARLPAPRGSR